MHPTLIEIGPLVVHTYGFFIALAFIAAILWSMREARQRGLSTAMVQDIGFWGILGAIAGSRLLYVLLNPRYFLDNPLDIIMFWKGGLVFLGGALMAGGLIYWHLRRHGQSIPIWADTMIPGLALGQAIGRFGCLAAGCCYGQTCELPWAITFANPDTLAPMHVSLHPTQLYHSLAGLTIFVVMLLAKRRLQTPGRLFGLYLVLYPVFRFTIEFFRDDYRGEFGFLSVTQVIAIGLFLTGLWVLTRKPKDSRK